MKLKKKDKDGGKKGEEKRVFKINENSRVCFFCIYI